MTKCYTEQISNLKEHEFDDIMDHAHNFTKVSQHEAEGSESTEASSDLTVLVRPPEEHRDFVDEFIPEGLLSDSPPPMGTGSNASNHSKQI